MGMTRESAKILQQVHCMVYVCTYMYVFMYVCVCIYACMCVCVYACMCVCVCVCVFLFFIFSILSHTQLVMDVQESSEALADITSSCKDVGLSLPDSLPPSLCIPAPPPPTHPLLSLPPSPSLSLSLSLYTHTTNNTKDRVAKLEKTENRVAKLKREVDSAFEAAKVL